MGKYNTKATENYMIDLSKLEVGMVVNTYKEMCSLMNEKTKSNNAKIAQIDEWKRYFSYDKDKFKFIITEIYDKPLAKKASKRITESLYVKFIELILINDLSNKDGNTCSYTKTKLFHMLGMSNENYYPSNKLTASRNRKEIVNIPKWQVDHFYQRSYQKLTEVLISALNSMKRRCLIMWHEQYRIAIDTHSRVASKSETENILIIQHKVLNDMGLTKIPFFNPEPFYKQVNKELRELYEWDYVYKEYDITFNSVHMKGDIKVVENEINEIVYANKMELNASVLDVIDKQAEFIYKKNCDEYKILYDDIDDNLCFGTMGKVDYHSRIKIPDFFSYPWDYIENQKTISKLFLSLQD